MATATKRVLVWNGKHDREYFDASTPEILAESCLELIRKMDSQGWYVIEELYEEESDEVIEALPEPYKAEALKKKADVVSRNKELTRSNETILAMRRAVDDHDVSLATRGAGRHERTLPTAWSLLQSRSDYEYEHVSLESVWSPEAA
jgi:hypothetical protein